MIFRNIGNAAEFRQISNGVVAGTGDTQTFTEVPLQGQFDSVLFLLNLGAVTSTGVGTLRAKGTQTSGTYSSGTIGVMLDPQNPTTAFPNGTIANATCGTGDSDTVMVLDIYRPQVPFVRAELVRATANIVILAVTALLYHSHSAPWFSEGNANNGAATFLSVVTPGVVCPTGLYIVSNPVLSLV
jgi:hypothetical protein